MMTQLEMLRAEKFMNTYTVRVWYWNSNGTNDIEILDSDGGVVDSLEGALFGVNIRGDFADVDYAFAMRHVAVHPGSNGSKAVKLLKKYLG